MSTAVLTAPTAPYQLGERHEFESMGKRFFYLVPSGAVFRHGRNCAGFCRVRGSWGGLHRRPIFERLQQRGYSVPEIAEAFVELQHAEIIGNGERKPVIPTVPEASFPLATDCPERHQPMQSGLRLLL